MKNLRDLPKLRDSLSYVYFEHARIEQTHKAVSVRDEHGETHVPAAALGVVMLGPGTVITHSAVKTLTDCGCTILWVGDGGTRYYAQGHGETRSSRRLLRQATCHADTAIRAAVVMKMYELRFEDPLPGGLTIEQVRGREGVRVRTAYARASKATGVPWHGRRYDRGTWHGADRINRALSTAASCLYGICQCGIISAGYSPALGFIHTGKMLSFVYDIADLYRIDVILPIAFEVCSDYLLVDHAHGMGASIRAGCRDAFHKHRILDRLVKDMDQLFSITHEDIDRASGLLDGEDNPPGGLWNPPDSEVEGGRNYDPDHS